MSSLLSFEHWDEDAAMENYVREYDKTVMPVPSVEFEPYILLNKVRKHYMEYIIKLLSVNYERNLRIPNKRLYRLPSAIWRCAKGIEMSAAQTSMVLQIYRRNILAVVEELKNDTESGIMNKKLYDCLHKEPENEKRTQTTLINSSDCSCTCSCNQRKKFKKSESPSADASNASFEIKNQVIKKEAFTGKPLQAPADQVLKSQIALDATTKSAILPTNPPKRTSETPTSDELVKQLEKLFEGDGDDDDIFESVLCDDIQDESSVSFNGTIGVEKQDSVVEAHSAQIRSLDERLITLTGLLANNTDKSTPEKLVKPETPVQRRNKITSSKWLCEEYFLKMKLLEMLDQIRDFNRSRFKEIKLLFADLFGDESDEEDLLSPLIETHEFILSCKERIAPWIVKMLTPYYIKGRIKGKALFKALAKHLIRLIYQCSQYPEQYEVHSFVSDFLKTHKVIRCEADFKEFRIMNI